MTTLIAESRKSPYPIEAFERGLITESEYYRLTSLQCTPSVNIPSWGLVYVPQTIDVDLQYNSGFDYPCICCKTELDNETHATYLHIVEGGGFAVHAMFQAKYDGVDGDMYFHPICDDCLKKFPQLAFFAQSIDPIASIGFFDDEAEEAALTLEMEAAWELEQERLAEARHWEQQADYEVKAEAYEKAEFYAYQLADEANTTDEQISENTVTEDRLRADERFWKVATEVLIRKSEEVRIYGHAL